MNLRGAVMKVSGRQTMTDFELLVVGDGCTDDSEAVVAGIGDPRVRWINLPTNTGHQSGPNNEGLRQARGEIIAYLGHDDLWLPHHLATMVAALDAGADVATSIVALVWPEASVVMPVIFAPELYGDWMPPTGSVHRAARVQTRNARLHHHRAGGARDDCQRSRRR